ncbi:MAG TPA: DUF4388 domain-containing protein, partial [Planctomycetota bacterium]|nr:DUF4388 domain-containing protein [Planctomycetota bacterium]
MTGSGGILNSEEVDFLLEGAEKSAGGNATPETDQVVTMHGDLEQINLSDIFQTLALTKMEGMLRVRNPLEQRHVYFRDGFVRILVPNRVATRRLGQRLVQAGLLEPDALRSALIEQRKESLPLGVLLAQKGYVAQEQVEEVVAMQVTEELFSLFTWRHGAFEFFKGECKDPLLLGRLESCPEFEVNSLLLEVARRSDEWEGILKSLGNLDEVPGRTGTDAPADLTEGQQAIFDAVDGKLSYRELAESSLLTLFDAARAARDLIELQLVASIGDDAMLELAGHLAAQGHPKRAMVVLQTLRDRPGERPLPVIARMAEVLQQCGETRLAAHLLLQGAQLQTDGSAALELARQARTLAGRDVEVLRFLRSTLTSHGEARPGELNEVTLSLFDNLLEAGEVDPALELLDELERQSGNDPQLVQRRVRALQRKKDVAGAVAAILAQAELHANKGERDKVIELYEQALKLDRDRKDIQKQLRVLTTTRKSRLARLATMAAVLLLLLTAGIAYLHSSARSDAVMRATTEVGKLLHVNDRVGAQAAVDRLLGQYGACTEAEDLQRQIDFNEKAEQVKVRREERRRATDQLAEAARLLMRADVEGAFKVYGELHAREEMRQEVAEAVATRLEAAINELDTIAKTLPAHLPPPPDDRLEPRRVEQNLATVRERMQPEKLAFCRNMEAFQQGRGLPNFVDPVLTERLMKAVRAGKAALDRGQQLLQEYELAQQKNASERRLDPLFKA